MPEMLYLAFSTSASEMSATMRQLRVVLALGLNLDSVRSMRASYVERDKPHDADVAQHCTSPDSHSALPHTRLETSRSDVICICNFRSRLFLAHYCESFQVRWLDRSVVIVIKF